MAEVLILVVMEDGLRLLIVVPRLVLIDKS